MIAFLKLGLLIVIASAAAGVVCMLLYAGLTLFALAFVGVSYGVKRIAGFVCSQFRLQR